MSQNLRLRLALMGGGGGSFVPPEPEGYISFTDGPNVVLVDHSTTDVSATCTTTDLTPATVDHYYGIWLSTSNPSTADVIAGTGAVYHNSDAGIASGVEVTFSFAAVTADISYTLHWVGRHEAENKQTRGTSVIFMLANAPPTGQPVITGTVEYGETLTNDPSAVQDLDGLGPFSYQWYRVNSAIAGATNSTYVVQGADEFQTLKTAVAYIDGAGKTEGPIYSDPTVPVPEYNRPATGAPLIQGTVAYQETVTAGLGNINDPNGVPDYGTNPELWSFQWNRDGAPISGATDISYLIAPADINTNLTVSASFTDNAGFPEGPLTSTSHLVPDANIEYFKDFSLSDNTGWTHTRGSKATMHDYLGNIVTVNGTDAHDEAFIGSEYTDPDTYVDHGVGYGIQLEDARTNLVRSSEDMTSSWNDRGTPSIISSTLPDPAGGLTGVHLQVDAKLTQDIFENDTVDSTPSSSRAVSVWMHRISTTGTIRISNSNTGDAGGRWDIDLSLLSEAWERVTEDHAAVTVINPMVGDASTGRCGFHYYSTTGAHQLAVWGHQQEDAAFPSSYIPTSGTAVTRAATNLSAPFSALSPLPAGGVVNDFCGQVVFVMPADVADIPTGEGYFSLLNEANVTEARLGIHNTSATNLNFGMRDSVGWFDLGNTEYGNLRKGDVADIRFRYSSGGLAFWVNGVKTTAAGRAGFGAPLSTVRVGRNYTGDYASAIKATITRIVPAALTDEDITAWEGWTEPLPIITEQPTDIDFGGAPPVEGPSILSLLFSDLIDGPYSGWSVASATMGAVVTVWGTGFGATQGSMKLMVGDYEVPAGNIIEWGVTGQPIPWLQHISFHLDSNMPTGDTFIQIDNAGALTEQLPFHVRTAGRILFIDNKLGSNGDGSFETPWNHLEGYFVGTETHNAGDVIYVRSGEHNAGPSSSGRAIYGYSARATSGEDNNRCAIVAYPGEDVFLNITESTATSIGITIQQSFWVVSKFRVECHAAALEAKGGDAESMEDSIRIVGNKLYSDLGGLSGGGTGLISTPYSSRIDTLGNECYGIETDDALDHAIYYGGAGINGPQECAYNFMHSCVLDIGAALSVNYQQTRVPSGDYARAHYIHHNLIDTRSPDAGSKEWTCEGINVWNLGDLRDPGDIPQPADTCYVFNNVVIGDSRPVKDGTGGLTSPYVHGGSAFDVQWYNNTAINFNEDGAFAMGYHGVDGGSEAHMILKGNMAVVDDANGRYFKQSNLSPAATHTSENNSFYGGNTLPPNDTGSITSDPQITADLVNYAFSLASTSPAKGIATDPGIAKQTRDYNHKPYSTRFDAGAIQAEEG